MGLFKGILGLNHHKKWTRWLNIGALVAALLFALAMMQMFSMGLVGTAIVFLLALVVAKAIAAVINTAINSVHSGKRQVASLRESESSGSAEMLDLDKLRLKVQALTLALIIAGAIYIVVNLITALKSEPNVPFMIIGLVVIIAIAVVRAPAKRQYTGNFKEQIVRKGLEAVLDDLEYQPEGKLEQELIDEARIFHQYDRYNGNDFISASYKGTKFVQSDVHLEKEKQESYRDSDGDWHTRTVYETVFMGRLVVLDYDALCDDAVYIYDRRNQRRRDGITETEMAAFNDRFLIDAQDAVTALRIVTPQVQVGLLEASERLGYCMSLAFVNDKLFIAIFSGDMFEAKTGGDMTLSEQRQRVSDHIQSILGLLDSIHKEGGKS